ncbi:MAG: hypothetical protein JW923_08665 [Spirochaetales bacterium]|nr:hypothetical protein [Spirochaetales bacterium]
MIRLAVYMGLQATIFALGGWALVLPAALTLALGAREGLRWARWFGRSWAVLAAAVAPAVVSVPIGSGSAFLELWAPGLERSARFMLVLTSAAWLSHGMSPLALKDALTALLKPFGRPGVALARALSLTLAFLPWTRAELRQADEAARLRGSDPKARPLRHAGALTVPVTLRALEKARRSAEALALRDASLYGP